MKHLFWLVLLFMCSNILCYLNIDELKSVNYGIYIDDHPVVLSEELPLGTITLASKHGQRYQCSYPDMLASSSEEEISKKIAMETGMPQLLQSMADGPCLFHTTGWWTYEFCYGKEIKQFHVGESQVPQAVTSLGVYSSDQQWDDDIYKEKRRRHLLFHSQQFVNGTLCALTNRPRNVEVRFSCGETRTDYIERVDEPATCSYVLNVRTNRLCAHPYMQVMHAQTPARITCNPLLERDQYDEYLRQVKEEDEDESETTESPQISADSSNKQESAEIAKNEEGTKDKPMLDLTAELGAEKSAIVNEILSELAKYKASEKLLDTYFKEQGEMATHYSEAKTPEDKLAVLRAMQLKAIQLQKEAINTAADADATAARIKAMHPETTDQNAAETETDVADTGNTVRAKVRIVSVNEVKKGGTKEMGEVERAQGKKEDAAVQEGQAPKFEVKIVSAAYYDERDGQVHMLDDLADNKAFKELIVTVLGGNNDVNQEMSRHVDMEQKYGRVWGQGSRQRKSTTAKKALNSR